MKRDNSLKLTIYDIRKQRYGKIAYHILGKYWESYDLAEFNVYFYCKAIEGFKGDNSFLSFKDATLLFFNIEDVEDLRGLL